MADDCALDILPWQKAIRAWIIAGSGLPSSNVYWGEQDSERPPEPSIEMRLYSTHTLGLAWVDSESSYLTFSPLTVALVLSSTDTLMIVGHGLQNGDGPITLASTGTVPGGTDATKDYWVVLVDDDHIKLADSYVASGGAYVDGSPSGNPVTAVDITSPGTGTITVHDKPNHTLRAGQEVRYVARSIQRMALMLTSYASTPVGMSSAFGLLNRIKSRQSLPSQQAILKGAKIGLNHVERVRVIHGVRNAVQFEPRAICEILFNVVTEECEPGTVIERADITNQASNKTFRIGVLP